jgi:hypothetical protein
LGEKLPLAASLGVKNGKKGAKTPFGNGCFQNTPKINIIILGN